MSAYRSKGGDVRIATRVTFRLTLADLMYAMYASDEETGATLTRREVRRAVANRLEGAAVLASCRRWSAPTGTTTPSG